MADEKKEKEEEKEPIFVELRRQRMSDQGTEGLIVAPGFACYTLELPWRENRSNISCIPEGEYKCEIRRSPKFGLVYWVKKVPKREFILIHSGNFAGDVSRGWKSHVNGCILLGLQMGFIAGQRAVINSRIAVVKFVDSLQYEPFNLRISGGVDE
jgi:hypothetical protein